MTLEILTSPHLAPLAHGFLTRRGGASSGIFAGLNCGAGSSDLAGAVQINRQRVAQAFGLEPGALRGVRQVHAAGVAVIGAASPEFAPEADAMVTATPGIGLSVLTADCQPVLFADRAAGVIGAAHAGWRGTLEGVLEAVLEAMEGLGARRAAILAAIGPAISQRAYEVGPDLFYTVTEADPAGSRFFAAGEGGRLRFDLPGYGLHRLRAAGIGAAQWTGHCTYSDAGRFFSYRRSLHLHEADYGRLISVIRL